MSRHEDTTEETVADIRASLEAAFEPEEKPASETAPDVPGPVSTADAGSDAAGEGSGESAAPETEGTAPSGDGAPGEGGSSPDTEAGSSSDSSTENEGDRSQGEPKIEKAPQSWKPAARENWSTLPAEVRAEIHRREADIQRGLRDASEFSKLGKTFKETVAPYEATIRTLGVSAEEAVGELFKTDHTLRHGRPQEKAARLLGLMEYYGVDIDDMNAVLTGQESDSTPQLDPAVEQRLARLEQTVPAIDQDNNARASQMLREFLSTEREFYEDVKGRMADLIGAGAASTLEDAYEMAIWADGETRKVLLQREAAQKGEEARRKAEEAARAAGSVTGSPRSSGSVGHVADPTDLRGTLNAAFAAPSGRV